MSDIGKASPYRIEESFLGCSSLESLDLSGWNTSYAVMDNGQVVRLFDECPNLHSVKIGSNWTWNQNGYGLLPIQSFDGADGKWYSLVESYYANLGVLIARQYGFGIYLLLCIEIGRLVKSELLQYH